MMITTEITTALNAGKQYAVKAEKIAALTEGLVKAGCSEGWAAKEAMQIWNLCYIDEADRPPRPEPAAG